MMRGIRNLAGRGVRHPNLQAAGIALTTMAAVYLNTDPLPAGSEPFALEAEMECSTADSSPSFVGRPPAVPVPVPLSDGLEPVITQSAPSEAAPVAVEAASPVATPAAPQQSPILTGKWAMRMNVLIMQKGLVEFSKHSDYTATFTKTERIGGDLTKEQQIALKLRHEPFSVYMKWRSGETGQQVIYVTGQNEGKMLVKPGGIKGRLVPGGALGLDPEGSLAQAAARYPVTMIGLKALSEQAIRYQEHHLEAGTKFECELREDAEFDGHPCYRFYVVYDNPETSPLYRKSEILINKQNSMPVFVKNHTWAKEANPETLDEETLIEHYTYTDIHVSQQLADRDFDRANEAYRMVR